MGWNGNTTWDLTFRPGHTVNELSAELQANEDFWSQWFERPDAMDHAMTIRQVLSQFGEDADFVIDENSVKGWTGGKANDIGPDPQIVERESYVTGEKHLYNQGGLGVYTIFAKHMDGTVDWDSDEDGPWAMRVRLADGAWTQYDGVMTYPGDPGDPDEAEKN